jgi:hypothetical protein
MLDHAHLTLIEQQDNYPVLNESVAPTAGYPWSWSASGLSGFSAAPSFWFEYGDDGSGEPNELHTQAELHWSGIVASDWQNAVTGSFTLTLSNGYDSDRNYAMELTLRRLNSDGYTIVEQQGAGGSMINSAGANGFSFQASGYAGLSPAPSSIAFNAMGAVTSCTCVNWNQNGTFTLTVQDGSRPESHIYSVALSLRSLIGDGYTVIEGQTSGEVAVNAPGSSGFYVSADQFDWGGADPPVSSLTLNNMGSVTGYGFGAGPWDLNGTFRLRLQDGSRPTSNVTGRAISLRSLVADGYIVFLQQQAGGNMVNAPGAYGFTSSGSGFIGFSPVPTLWFGAMGSVDQCSCWNTPQDGTFTLSVADGTRPASVIEGVELSVRSVTPEYLIIDPAAGDGDAVLQVESDPGPWDWTDWEDGCPTSIITAPDTYGSATLTVSWLGEDLFVGEHGCGHITVAPSGSSAPLATLCLDVEIASTTCCLGRVGDANGAGGDEPTISDISVMIDAKFISGTCEGKIVCLAEADTNQSGGSSPTCDDITISDISTLIDYLFITGPQTATLLECL